MDFKKLAENLGLDEDEYMELIELFVETGLVDLDKLGSAVEREDLDEAAKAAHSLKGASGNLGLMEIYELAKSAEDKARMNDLDALAQIMQSIKQRLDAMAAIAPK